MNQISGSVGNTGPVIWDPKRYAKGVDPMEVKLSRGFLRSRPEKWCPGFAAQWLPLTHSLGADIKIVDVKPALRVPGNFSVGFAATIDDEPLGMFCDQPSASALVEAASPGVRGKAAGVLAEYLARRFLTSLSSSWSGPESSIVRFDTEMDAFAIHGVSSVRLAVEVNSAAAEIWLVLGKLLTERLDALWRKQIRSAAKTAGDGRQELRLEVAQLAVPPAMLVEYIRSDTVIDLEVPVTDTFTVRLQGKPWLPARICDVDGNLGFEIVAGSASSLTLPEGTTRLAIELGAVTVPVSQIAEIGQVGAAFDTGQPLTDQVSMVVNNEKVADARLCSFEGRFAVSVI